MDRPQPSGMEEVIDYKGWWIYRWRGWIGTKTIAKSDYSRDKGEHCTICDNGARIGEAVIRRHGTDEVRHYTCQNPTNPPDIQHAYYLACNKDGVHLYAACARNVVEAPAANYPPGGTFELAGPEIAVDEWTLPEEREQAKQNGLTRMKVLIDKIEVEGLPKTS